MKKLTKIDMFTLILKELSDPTQIAFIEHEIELLENKKMVSRKPTQKTQKDNEILKLDIVKFLQTSGKSFTITELQKNVSSIENFSNQRVSALLTQLVNSGTVSKTYEKRKAYFSAI